MRAVLNLVASTITLLAASDVRACIIPCTPCLPAASDVTLASTNSAVRSNSPVVDVDIAGFNFEPNNVVIPQGASVRWTNRDGTPHTSTGQTAPGTLVPSGLFDSGPLNENESFAFTFQTLGEVSYYCRPHPSAMQATVQVRRPGDASGDGNVNFDDLLTLARNYNQSSRNYTQGDFNLTNTPGSSLTAQASLTADWSLARSLIPEPAAVSLIAAASVVSLRRRR
jgi:plastocyanin